MCILQGCPSNFWGKKEDIMQRGKRVFNWMYFFQAEDSRGVAESRLAGACKAFLWLGISILMGIGVSQLT